MALKPKNFVSKLKLATHGGIDPAELESLGIDADSIIDFSVSTNPFMPPPALKEALAAAGIERYPDSRCTRLRRRLVAKLGIEPEMVIFGNGTTELLRVVATVYLRRNDTALLLEPTYGDYRLAITIAGARVVRHFACEKDNFRPVMEEVLQIIRHYQPQIIFICNPGNPTGQYLAREEVAEIIDEIKDGLLVLDEAYVSFVPSRWDSLDLVKRGNIIVLRSLTKDWGIPGLRLGYAIGSREILDPLKPVLPPWNVNAVAQEAGLFILENEHYLEKSLQRLHEVKRFLVEGLTALGLKVIPSLTNYFLVKVGDASRCRSNLLKRSILVRDCSSFGLPEYIRVSVRTRPECERLLHAISDIIKTRVEE